MTIEYSIYKGHFFVYTDWMKNFVDVVEQQDGSDIFDDQRWKQLIDSALSDYSATMIHDFTNISTRLSFENEELATLFFLRFS
jgi:hypothetical protein